MSLKNNLEHQEIKPAVNHESDDATANKNFITKIEEYLNKHYKFRINVLTMEIEFCSIKKNKFKVLEDRTLNSIWLDLQKNGVRCSDSTLMKILNSDFTNLYHPIKEYFKNLPKYDGKDYIKQLAETITISDIEIDDIKLKELWYDYLKKFIVGSASTCLGLGTNHTCLVLVGGQGSGKTTWLNNLCPKDMKEFLVCSHINPSLTDKNTVNYLAEKWFLNIDDQLETIIGKDFNSMKALITVPFVTNRKLFHRLSKTRERICSFVASVNSFRFLADSENRRYLVFSTATINYNHRVDMAMVWSQALHLANNDFQYWFGDEEIKTLNKVNEIFKQSTPEEEWLTKFYKPCEASDPNAIFLMPSEILKNLNTHSGMKLSMKKLSHAMERHKFGQPISKRIKGVGARKVYAVLMLSDETERFIQKELKAMHQKNKK